MAFFVPDAVKGRGPKTIGEGEVISKRQAEPKPELRDFSNISFLGDQVVDPESELEPFDPSKFKVQTADEFLYGRSPEQTDGLQRGNRSQYRLQGFERC